MGRKPLDRNAKEQLILLSASGESTKTIAEIIDRTEQTVRNYQKKFESAIDAKKQELSGRNISEGKTGKGGFQRPPKEMESDSDNKNTEDNDPIEVKATPDFIKKGATVASDELRDMYKDIVRDGKAIMNARMRYQTSLENMGVPWDKFLTYSMEVGYGDIEQEYIRQLEKYKEDQAMAEKLEEALYEDELKNMYSGNLKVKREVEEIEQENA